MQRVLAVAVLVACCVPLSLVAFDTDGPVATPTSAAVAAILAAMNRERAARGLAPLRLNERLCAAARDRIDDMFAKRYFAHQSPDGIDPFSWVIQHGYRYLFAGENLATGYSGTSVVDGWMHSPGHRRNVLGADYTEVGIAVADGSPLRTSGYRGPTVVALYGSR
ncbi:MAG: hypothetical protein JO197_22775 [Acidobacteria bacterium]|nr:hypothetical protein [Acidobacteriota bacterium]